MRCHYTAYENGFVSNIYSGWDGLEPYFQNPIKHWNIVPCSYVPSPVHCMFIPRYKY